MEQDGRAEEVLQASSSSVTPSEVFDQLLLVLDEKAQVPDSLEQALRDPRFENR